MGATAHPGAAADVGLARLADIERAGVRAWPARESRAIGGWLWRYSAGGSQRANSVASLEAPDVDVEAAIDAAERHYAARGAPPRFQITGATCPGDLDARLARRGYRINDSCWTMAAVLAADPIVPSGIEIANSPGAGWLEVYLGVQSPDRRAVAPLILSGVPQPRAFVSALDAAGRVVSTALGVVTDDVVVAECVATRHEARRQGGAARVMRGIGAWGAGCGARIAALGMTQANVAGRALYESVGFRVLAGYHFRIRDGGSAS